MAYLLAGLAVLGGPKPLKQILEKKISLVGIPLKQLQDILEGF